MQILVDLVTNATMQAWIWGPLMGVVFGALFAGLTRQPAVGAPVTVIQTTNIFIRNTVPNRASNGGADGMGGVLLGAVLGLIFVVWNYAVHIELVHYWLWVVFSTVLSFCLTVSFVSLVKGQFTSGSWGVYVATPLVLLAGCGYVIDLAKTVFDPQLTQLALQYNFLKFYTTALSPYGRSLMLSHVIGVSIAFLIMVFTGVALLHYLALMNQRSLGVLHGFWVYLARITLSFSGKAWFILLAGCLLFAYLAVAPWAIPMWITRQV
ncbi:hypothetical protein SRABI70_03462 [Pseudomonas sp. Bi70]|uniref:hypothetical protein n=1 Tax=Pseudomonas sp. Bi70 TaxID=2821127 RepID=UPI001DE0D484|nr:hypothetical protein [Pseudomonas sp. Bi70]CAH0270143.1 hypothetical protein SRABI70_03462 [Pseudomonas sp. Bi70]